MMRPSFSLSTYYGLCIDFLGWLEALLDRIARNPRTVVCPIIDTIEEDTFEYQYRKDGSFSVGGFYWDLVVRFFFLFY